MDEAVCQSGDGFVSRIFLMPPLRAQAVDVVADIFENVGEPLHAVEDVEHPEGIEEKQEDDDRGVDRLGHDRTVCDVRTRDMIVDVDDVEHVHEPEEEDAEEDDLEEHEIEMPHEPLGGYVVQVPDFRHEIFISHLILLKGILSDLAAKAIVMWNFFGMGLILRVQDAR